MRFPQDEVTNSLRHSYYITSDRGTRFPQTEDLVFPLTNDNRSCLRQVCVNSFLGSYVCTPVEYELLPYLLIKRKCVGISERDRIIITWSRFYTLIQERDLNCRRYCLEVLHNTYKWTYTGVQLCTTFFRIGLPRYLCSGFRSRRSNLDTEGWNITL